MVFSLNNGVMDAPIPGQSLTQTPGASPNEHPPQFVNLDDALDYVWDRFHKPKALIQLIGYLKAGIPVEVIARTVLYQGLLKNNWNVDLSLLMLQTVIWQIEAIAKLKKIKVQTYVDDTQHTKSIVSIGNMLDSKKSQKTVMSDSENNTQVKGFF